MSDSETEPQPARLKRTPPRAEFTTSRAGLHFHIALVFVPMLLVSLPIVVGLAIYNGFRPELHEEHKKWSRRLLALALFDSVTILLLTIVAPDLGAVLDAAFMLALAGPTWLDFLPLPVFLSVWAYAFYRKHPAPRLWIALLAILFVSLLVVPLGIQLLLQELTGTEENAHGVFALTGQVLVLGGLGFLWFRRYRGDSSWGAKHGLRPGRTYVLSLIYLLGALGRLSPILLIVEVFFSSTSESPVEYLVEGLASETNWIASVLLVLTVGVIGPIAEELCFRGVFLPAIGKWATPRVAIFMTSMAFASLHAFYGFRVLGVLVIGAVLGWARWRSRSLEAPILLHITINMAAVAALLLSE